MDSRDSSSLLPGVSRDEGDGHLSVTTALAKDAALLFQSRRFTECLDLLHQLLQKKEDDPKVSKEMESVVGSVLLLDHVLSVDMGFRVGMEGHISDGIADSAV